MAVVWRRILVPFEVTQSLNSIFTNVRGWGSFLSLSFSVHDNLIVGLHQREFNDLLRTRLCRIRMILLQPALSHLSRQCPGDTLKIEKGSQLADGGGGGSQITRQQESLVLYKSFNILWPTNKSANWGNQR
jgi:hypothetical protein